MTTQEAIQNIKKILDVTVVRGGIFENALQVRIALESVETLENALKPQKINE